MNAQPLVTIGLPFYNDRKTLKLAIQSVFAQTYTNWELIMVDDGSSDGAGNIARQVTDPRVQLIADGKNKGLIARLNELAQVANGVYLARMDADDLMDPTRIEKQVKRLLEMPEVDLVDTGTYSIDQDGIPCGKRGLNEISNSPKHILKHAMLLHASVTGKKKWFQENPYNEGYIRAEDYELWCRTFRHSKFSRIMEPLYIVREGKVNVRNYAKSARTVRKIFRNYGPGILSPREIIIELIKSHLKVLTYKIFSFLNKHDYLSKKRNLPLKQEETQRVKAIIKEIENTNVKGIDG